MQISASGVDDGQATDWLCVVVVRLLRQSSLNFREARTLSLVVVRLRAPPFLSPKLQMPNSE